MPTPAKQIVARSLRWRWLQRLMLMGIHIFVPRHRVGIAVVVLNGEGQILLLEHVFHPYVRWGLPGGWLNRDEQPAAGAARELREETGMEVEMGPVIHLEQEVAPRHLNIAYLARVLPGSRAPVRLSGEIISAGWFAPDRLPTPLLPFTRNAIDAALRVEWEAA
ncbi:MAG: NUDIX domain-containing protein [Candidatus Promineifilaceae bacterium]|nr:NUDIX domain-containing protein [Candidatus Promineifilaceae bacterium]